MSVHRYKELGFVTLEFRKREDADICLNLDGTEFKSGYKMRLNRVKRFIDEWNAEIDKGRNPINTALLGGQKGNHFSEDIRELPKEEEKNEKVKKKKDDDGFQTEFKLYMGNIPLTMTDGEVRKLCESFGRLKNFNLMKDLANPELNKGFAFFEYVDQRAADKAV